MKIKFRGPPRPPKKADFGRTKAEMGYLSQNGLFYSFEILNKLLSKTDIRNPKKKIFWESPLHPQLTLFWPKNGEKFPLAPMGFLAPVEIFWHVCLQS